MLTKLEYQAGLIKEESTSELLRFTIRYILNQVHNQPEYLVLKQEQQQIHNQFSLYSNTASSKQQVSKLSQTKDILAAKMKLSSIHTQ
jgi:short subunit dehydrogenase-like uncharacterized protein